MVKNNLENPQEMRRFESLDQLKNELSRSTKNKERFVEFERTINEALQEGEKQGVIEFTEDEWKTLISNEKLPPIEVQKSLLKEKIDHREAVKEVSREKREWIMWELDKKVEEAKKAVNDIKQKTKETLSPLEKIKANFVKIGNSISESWNTLWTPIKFAWYTLWASLGFKFGKDALTAMTKEKAEKALENAKEKTGEIIKEWVVEKAAPLAILWGAGVGIFAFIKNKLPAWLSRSIEGNGTNILKAVGKNRALRMFGVWWALLFGLSQIANVMENPEIANKVWPLPENPEERKTWIKKVLSYCGGIWEETKKSLWDFFSQSKDVITGKTLDEYLTKKESEEEIPEDMQRLEEAFWPTKLYLEELGYDINYMAKNFAKIVVWLSIFSQSIRAVAIKWTMSAGQLWLFLLQGIGKNLFSSLFVIGIACNAAQLGGHKILVPRDPTKMQDWLRDLIQIPDVRAQLEKEWVDATLLQHAEENLNEAITLMTDTEKRDQRLKQERKRVMDKLKDAGLSLIAPERKTVLKSKNLEWFRHAETSFTHFLKNPNEREKELIQHIKNLSVEIEKWKEITATDIANLITASAGTRVSIHNKDNDKYIRWSIRDEAGFRIDDESADNLCVNPKLDSDDQYRAARVMPVGKEGWLGAWAALFEGMWWWVQSMPTKLREALSTNKLQEWANILQQILNNKIPIIRVGSEIYIDGFMFPADLVMNTIDYLDGDIALQELMIETGDGIVPCMVFGWTVGTVKYGIERFISGDKNARFKKRILLSSTLWITQWKMLKKGAGLIFHGPQKFKKWYEGIINMLADKRLKIESWFEQLIEWSRKYNYFFGGSKELRHIAKDLGELSEIKKNLTIAERASGSRDIDINRKKEYMRKMHNYIKEITKDLSPSEKKNHFLAHLFSLSDNPSAAAIEEALKTVNTDINSRTWRRIVIHAEQQINIRRQAEALAWLPEGHPRWARLKKAKGIAGVLAALAIPVWAALGADALNNHETANEETDDLGDSYEAPDYGEFEWDISKSEKIDNYAPEMRWVFQEIDTIKDTLVGEKDVGVMKLMLENNIDFYMKNDEEKVKNMITELTPRYEASVERFRKICQNNKASIERYFKENPEKQKQEIKICAFLWLGWEDGKLELRSMSREKFETHFYTTLDHVKDNISDYQDDGQQSGWEKAWEVGKNLVPIVSSWIDTKQAWRDLSRGHIKSWLLNGWMAALWWASDISLGITIAASVLTLGSATPSLAIPAALRAGVIAAKWSKVVKWIIITERAAEIATQTAQGIYLSVEKDVKEYL